MRISRRISGVAAGLGMAVAVAVVAAPPASATHRTGKTPLSAVLTSDGNRFDRNSNDYDITTEAVLAVLKAKPTSAVGVLTDGSVRLTAFVPTDKAFRLLVKDVTGKNIHSEKKVFEAVAGLGIDTVETVLLYHVVPGATITARQAFRADGAKLTTAQGGKIRVDVRHHAIFLKDKDRNDRNPQVVVPNINKGNKQIAHGINRVLRPVDL